MLNTELSFDEAPQWVRKQRRIRRGTVRKLSAWVDSVFLIVLKSVMAEESICIRNNHNRFLCVQSWL